MSLEKMTCGVNYTTNLLRDNVNGLIDSSSISSAVVWLGLDSLTAGSGGVSYVVPFEKMARGSVGWGGRWVPFDNANLGSETDIYKAGTQLVVDLPYSDTRRKMSFDGKGAYASVGADFTFQLQPTFNWSYVDIYYLQQPSGASVDIDRPRGQDVVVLNTSGELSVKKVRIYKNLKNGTTQNSTTTDVNNIRLRSSSLDGELTVFGVIFYSGNGGPVFLNASKGGQKTQEVASFDSETQRDWFSMMGVTHAILCAGMNDRSSRTPSEFSNDLDSICNRFDDDVKQYIVRPNDPSDLLINQYDSIYINTAAVYGTLIDLKSMFGSYSQVLANGQMLDGVHPNIHYQYFQAQAYSVMIFGKAIYKNQEALIDYYASSEQ